jgi:hypothetical protein
VQPDANNGNGEGATDASNYGYHADFRSAYPGYTGGYNANPIYHPGMFGSIHPYQLAWSDLSQAQPEISITSNIVTLASPAPDFVAQFAGGSLRAIVNVPYQGSAQVVSVGGNNHPRFYGPGQTPHVLDPQAYLRVYDVNNFATTWGSCDAPSVTDSSQDFSPMVFFPESSPIFNQSINTTMSQMGHIETLMGGTTTASMEVRMTLGRRESGFANTYHLGQTFVPFIGQVVSTLQSNQTASYSMGMSPSWHLGQRPLYNTEHYLCQGHGFTIVKNTGSEPVSVTVTMQGEWDVALPASYPGYTSAPRANARENLVKEIPHNPQIFPVGHPPAPKQRIDNTFKTLAPGDPKQLELLKVKNDAVEHVAPVLEKVGAIDARDLTDGAIKVVETATKPVAKVDSFTPVKKVVNDVYGAVNKFADIVGPELSLPIKTFTSVASGALDFVSDIFSFFG